MTQISIAVNGSCNIDVVVEAPKRPLAGETILGSRLIIAQGGKGANQAVAAARLGAKVYMVGCVGDDDYGRSVIKNFEANGVDTGNVKVVPGVTTGSAHITLAEGDNSIIVIKGANDLVTPELIDEAWPQIAGCDMVMLQHEIPAAAIAHTLKKCAEAGVKALLNPAPVLEGAQDWAKDAAFITPNEHEAQALFPGKSTEEILLENEGRLLMTLGSNMDFFNFHIFGKFFHNFQKTRRAELQGKVNLFYAVRHRQPAVADNDSIGVPHICQYFGNFAV